MRLLVITNDYPPVQGGIENYTFSLVSRWPAEKVTVLTRWVPGCERFDARHEIEVIREPVGTLLATPALRRKVTALLRGGQFDAVYFPSAMPTSLLGPRSVAPTGIPYAVTAHGGEFLLASRLPWVKRQLRKVLMGASVIMPQATTTMEAIRQWMPGHPPMELVTCGVDLERFRPSEPDPDRPVILSVSRLVSRKGPATLLRALPRILRSHPQARVVIVGGGPDRARLEGLASKLSVEKAVTFAGPQAWEDIAGFYSSATLFALPTRERFGGLETEGLPLVFVEAAASSLPLIGGNAGGVKDAVRPGETGYLVDGKDPAQTSAAVIELLDDPEKARQMGRRARAMVESEFSWDGIFRTFAAEMSTHCS